MGYGTNFTAGQNELRATMKGFLEDKEVQAILAEKEIIWNFQTPYASSQSGTWDRCIWSGRRIADAIMGERSTLEEEKFITLLVEIEDILNQRPLTPNPTSPYDKAPLTLNDLIKLGASARHPLGKFTPSDIYVSRHVLHLADLFWCQWQDEYLPTLWRQSKWSDVKTNL